MISLWDDIRTYLKSNVPSRTYKAFVETASCSSLDGKKMCLTFDSNFSKESFEQKCLPGVRDFLSLLHREEIQIELIVSSEEGNQELLLPLHDLNPYAGFDTKYTFETFVVGTSNQFAHAACQAVAKQPGQTYNPLFIFGGAGLGKTHLMKAIGHSILHGGGPKRIFLLTSETFTNELIHAIRSDRMQEFRDKYRSGCDVLLLDDVHFLAGKERTQEEFFYTFNYLHELRKQIVVTSDRYPRDIEGLENRLRTRFEWGLVVDIQPPDVETRVAILKNKAEEQGIDLSDDVAHFIAGLVTTNIRELEGSLHRVQAFASLTQKPLDLELVQSCLGELPMRNKPQLNSDSVLKLVALHYNVKTKDLKSTRRERRLSFPRQVAMYLLRKHLLLSYPEIGRVLGGKDHTTALHGVQRVVDLQRSNPEVLEDVCSIESLLR